MTAAAQALDRYDWGRIAQQLDAEGWALLPALFTPAQARALANALDEPDAARLAPAHPDDHRYLTAPLPPALDGLQTALHARLAPLAHSWAERLGRKPHSLPVAPSDLLSDPLSDRPPAPPVIHRLREGDAHPLVHETDEAAFALRLAVLLSEPGQEFCGGEFVMTEQRPRQQSRPLVLPLGLGDGALIAAAYRPIRGAQGDYRATLRHGISRVRSGVRVGLALPLGPSQRDSRRLNFQP